MRGRAFKQRAFQIVSERPRCRYSSSMLLKARSANSGLDNVQFLHNNGESLNGRCGRSSRLCLQQYSLQHSPRKNQRSLTKEFCRVLRPGGTPVFQTPSQQNMKTVQGILHFLLGNRVLNLVRRIKYGIHRVMETHTLEKRQVLELLGEEGMRIIDAERFDSPGTAFIGHRYFATKI